MSFTLDQKKRFTIPSSIINQPLILPSNVANLCQSFFELFDFSGLQHAYRIRIKTNNPHLHYHLATVYKSLTITYKDDERSWYELRKKKQPNNISQQSNLDHLYLYSSFTFNPENGSIITNALSPQHQNSSYGYYPEIILFSRIIGCFLHHSNVPINSQAQKTMKSLSDELLEIGTLQHSYNEWHNCNKREPKN